MTSVSSPGAPGDPLAPPWQPRRAYRSADDGVVAGVATGLAVHLGLPVRYVRIGFLAGALLSGFGVLVYAALWIFMPLEPTATQAPGLAAAGRDGRRPRRVGLVRDAGAFVALAALLLGLAIWLSVAIGQGAIVPLALGALGLFALWRQADEAQREGWRDDAGRLDLWRALVGSGGWASAARFATGAGLLLTALLVFAAGSGSVTLARDVIVAALLGVVGLGLVVGPWVVRLVGDLSEERAERVRSQERADMAAHLHDSVLQTLALIQRNSADPATVSRLARAQERDLRGWLYEAEQPGAETVVGAVRQAAAEVEDHYGVPVEVVAVGDAPHDADLRALVLAAREAMTNAAKHSGADRVDVYVEAAEPDAPHGSVRVELFVRDRGAGFDLARVAADRHGVQDSILDRMERHGGHARVRTAPGEGTEVRLFSHAPVPQDGDHDGDRDGNQDGDQPAPEEER